MLHERHVQATLAQTWHYFKASGLQPDFETLYFTTWF